LLRACIRHSDFNPGVVTPALQQRGCNRLQSWLRCDSDNETAQQRRSHGDLPIMTFLPSPSRWWAALLSLSWATLLQAQPAPRVGLDADGTVHVPAYQVRVSEFMSPEGRAYLVDHLHALRDPARLAQEDGIPVLLQPFLERQRSLFPVNREDSSLAGVHAWIYTPKAGIAPENADKVLINLHGGGFSGCWPACAELESMPIAALGRIKVVSLDYRQGPQHQHPAASEDVAAAYRELLQTYAPENIGIYGCSAGGMLTAMAVAWFQQEGLPRPGAIGILCAGAAATGSTFGGDANAFSMPLGEGRMMPMQDSSTAPAAGFAYFAGTDQRDPLISPVSDPTVLAQFPPTMILSGTRSFDLSNAVHTHIELSKLGVPAELYVWEGMFHGFFYNPDVPESRESFDFIVRFFAKWLGKA
jgi:monoterpene epsilon-lactone hydrolase